MPLRDDLAALSAWGFAFPGVTVQEHWVDWDDPGYETVGNIQLTRIMGGDIRMDRAGFDIGIRPGCRRGGGHPSEHRKAAPR